nr:zinc finger ccch domain-containing protein 65 [Quercus suber]
MEKVETESSKPSETPLSFTRRRSHLKSETYYTLVRILSHCYDKSQCSLADQVVPQEQNPDFGNDEVGKATGNEMCESVELVGPDRVEPSNLAIQKETVSNESFEAVGVQDKGFSDAQDMVIHEIERIMAVEENEDLLKQMDMMLGERTEDVGLQDKRFDKERILMDELENIVNGNMEPVHEISDNPFTRSLDKNQSGGDKVVPMNNPEEHIDGQEFVMEKAGTAQRNSKHSDMLLDKTEIGEVQYQRENGEENSLSLKANLLGIEHEMHHADMEVKKLVPYSCAMNSTIPITENAEIEKGECSSQKISEASDLSLDKDMICEPLKPSESMEEKSPLPKASALQMELETHPNEKELEKSVCSGDSLNFPNHMTLGGDIEEGEISGDDGKDDKSSYMFLEDAIVSEKKKVDEVQVSLDVIEKKSFHCGEVNVASKTSFGFTSSVDTLDEANDSREVEPKENDRNNMALRPKMVVHKKSLNAKKTDSHDLLLKEEKIKKKGSGAKEGIVNPPAHPINTTSSHGITSTDKQDASSHNKKKRGPSSEEKKTKKKQKDRKRRAEKNRALGVKRLKIHPVATPKKITFCHHYLKGRCQQGDECKFSHDTVPLTKSMPCCHFARHSCIKGDDCPYDHQLSKYPCDKFVKGFCSRGNDCMFSHKIPTKEDSAAASNDCKPEMKSPPFPGNTNISKQLNVTGSSLKNVDVLPASMGAHCHSNVKTLVKPPALAPKGISIFTAGKSSVVNSSMLKQGSSSPSRNGGAKVGSKAVPSASDTLQNMNVIPTRTSPSVVPKGINFLSFGKAPLDDAISKQVASLHSNRDSGTKLTMLDHLNLQKHDSLSPNNDVSIKIGNQASQSASKTIQNLNEMGQTAPDKSQNTSAISSRLPASPLASAKYGSEMRLNRSVGALGVSAEHLKVEFKSIVAMVPVPCKFPFSHSGGALCSCLFRKDLYMILVLDHAG